MNPQETLAYLTARVDSELEYTIDRLGELTPENAADELVDQLDRLRDDTLKLAADTIQANGGSLTEYEDGTPVVVTATIGPGRTIDYIRRTCDPVEIPEAAIRQAKAVEA